jgi:hypothetical protein
MTEQSPPPENPGAGERKYWLDSPANVDKIYWAVVVVCGALFLADALYHKHPEFGICSELRCVPCHRDLMTADFPT